MIITIDGPSGTGKTTIAKKVAESLKLTYFDTGAMYRSVALGLLQENIALSNQEAIEKFLSTFVFDIRTQEGRKHYFLGEEDVTKEIREQKVNAIVSEVAAMPVVRKAMWNIQRAWGEKQSAVFEGRDMGSVVFPKADVKVFLDASSEVRALRRLNELKNTQPIVAAELDEKKMEEELKRRDTIDSTRKLAPLKRPKGAYYIDTSELTIDVIVEKIVQKYHEQTKKLSPSWLRSPNMRFIYRFTLFVCWCVFKLFYRYKVYGLEHYVKRAAIIAPNHNSYLDPPITAISWPEEVHFLAKEELFKPFLFGRFIKHLNSHPVKGDVGDVSVFKTIIQLLKEGKQLILFPEGGRMEGKISEIKPGIGMLVMRAKAAIIPTYIHGAYEIWGAKQKLPKLFGMKCACVFGSPILCESFAHLDKRKAQEEIAKALSDSLHALKEWYDSGAKGIPP
ncbi:MAG: (d)CMP kinase [Simkaniaceae bacterium]|nr:(d)CMP kinase [Candidatus Sacchlamyda saccharinae]